MQRNPTARYNIYSTFGLKTIYMSRQNYDQMEAQLLGNCACTLRLLVVVGCCSVKWSVAVENEHCKKMQNIDV